MMMNNIKIEKAQPQQASDIASLIMLAMNHACCQYFAGPHHTLSDFHQLMTRLVERHDSQYSYLHTIVALDGKDVIGCCVSYEGEGCIHCAVHSLMRLWQALALIIPTWKMRLKPANSI